MSTNASLSPDLDELPDIVTSTQPTRVKHKRLSRDGRSLLLEIFYTKNITRPSKQQKEEFLQQVRALPNNDHFTMKSLERWFVTQRQKVQAEQNKDFCIGSGSSVKLPPEAIASLETLRRGTPQPSPEIINIWVDLIQSKFKAQPEDVRAWLDNYTDGSTLLTPSVSHSPSPTTAFHTHGQQIPSPLETNADYMHSWSPAQTSGPSHVTGPLATSNPYLILKREPSTVQTNLFNTSHSDCEEHILTQRPVPEPLRDPIRTQILLAVHEDLNSFIPPPRPKTRESLEAELAPYQRMMETFLAQVNDGLFTRWGFQPEKVVVGK